MLIFVPSSIGCWLERLRSNAVLCSGTVIFRRARIGKSWGGSSAGRASRSQCEGREFDPHPLHQIQVWLSPAKAGKSLSHKASGLFYVQVRPATSGGILRPEGAG